MPIDVFFRHLSDDQGERAIGIILSGMGTDGTLGVKAIKEKLGMDRREVPRILKEGLAKKKLKAKGQKRATMYTAS